MMKAEVIAAKVHKDRKDKILLRALRSFAAKTNLSSALSVNANVSILKNGIQRVVYSDNAVPWRSLSLGG